MNLDIQRIQNVTAEWLRLAVSGSDIGLYTASLDADDDADGFAYNLTSRPLPGKQATSPASLSLPQLLPVPPAWDLQFTGSGAGRIAATRFGGAWNGLDASEFSGSTVTAAWSYVVEQTDRPRFIRNSAAGIPAKTLVSAIFSGESLGIIGLNPDGAPGVSILVGSSSAPVQDGAVFGDLSQGLPNTLGAVWLQCKTSGAVAPNGMLPGTLRLASYDNASNVLGTPVTLFEGIEIVEFDVAVLQSYVCILASTGSGALLLGMVGADGTKLGTPNLPAGTWTNKGHWITSPSVVPTPGSAPGFTLAFIEMSGVEPVAVYVGTLSQP